MWQIYLAMILLPCLIGVLIWHLVYYKGEEIEVRDEQSD